MVFIQEETECFNQNSFEIVNEFLSLYVCAVSDDDTRRLIELRAANESLFTGRRNSAKPAWR